MPGQLRDRRFFRLRVRAAVLLRIPQAQQVSALLSMASIRPPGGGAGRYRIDHLLAADILSMLHGFRDLYATKSKMVRSRRHFAFSARAHHVARTVLVCAKIRPTPMYLFLFIRLGWI